MKTLLTIAGFDPSSGAGVTADLAVFSAHGMFGVAAVTALTVQSTLGVQAVHAVNAGILRETLACLVEDIEPSGIKIGMLADEANVRVVVEFLKGIKRRVPVVLDPVMRSSSGRELLSAAGVEALKRELLPKVDCVTPNRAELATLSGMRVESREEMSAAALRLAGEFTGLGVVATGGDLDSADDLLVAGGGEEWLPGERIESRATHGTGCAFSSALLCGLASGLDGVAAARVAKRYVSGAIRRAEPIGRGVGPMELLWPLRGS